MIRILFIISFSSTLLGQYNLVPNPSFEQCTICPNAEFGQIDLIGSPYYVTIPGWNNPNMASPDYYKLGILSNFIPPDGLAFTGMYLFENETVEAGHREYIQCELIDTLIFKKQYLINFYVNISSIKGNLYINNIGLHFSNSVIENQNLNAIYSNTSLIYFQNEIIKTTSDSFIQFSGIYEGNGDEKFMTIGVFDLNSNTSIENINGLPSITGMAYAYLDKFSVTPLDSIPGGLQVNAGIDQSICPGDTVFIGEKISNLPAYWYMLDGTVVDTNTAGVYVHPTVTTTYVVTMTINGVYSTDTVTVTVGCAGIDEPEKPSFTIGPNPNDGQFTINGQFSEGDLISIVSAEGRVVQTIHVDEQVEKQNIDLDLNPGIYLLQISTPQGNYCEKIRLE
jgi:hypothetical protein